ncbi:hypothetical protein CH253_18515 [Rhodococcus sp. 06-156-3C]|nr:hypothetical protein CH248_27715 [Rhodococcus sp. 06-156-4a]OZD17926.1 hypothetical protein CH253_18515 [Rhodococcus sp. 06-156-3C]OZD20650.1 hypothetical protein CH280_03670 [Rhodococcus sp. 06-156-4C]OZD30632.1 hypothetical protein CH247_15060 [Rhodococcus sp. 06-156-3b]OZD32596.1 hypothetical protein CH284_20200 [Rhodococcus sp. 06-156-3]OZF64994.1 hypothetical protein CH290_10385 [Rhodococcus sp. 06-156-4]
MGNATVELAPRPLDIGFFVTSITYVRASTDKPAELNPGSQKAAVVTGHDIDQLGMIYTRVVEESADHHGNNVIHTDWTTQTT